MGAVRWVAVAEVKRPHGVRGELRVQVYNSHSTLLVAGRTVCLGRQSGEEHLVTLASVRPGPRGALLVRVVGIDDPETAADYCGMQVSVERSEFPEPQDGEFYVCDLLGADVVGPSGVLGTVQDIVSYPASDALVIRPVGALPASPAVEVPLVDTFIDSIDADRKLVVARAAILEFFG